MALSKPSLKARIVLELQAMVTFLGIQILSTAQLERFAEAIANAVVDEIQANAEVTVPGGSSAGTYPVS